MRHSPLLLGLVLLFGCDSGAGPNGADGEAGAGDDAAPETSAQQPDAASAQDATPPNTCATPNDCTYPKKQICDPTSDTCGDPQCGSTSGKSCDASHVCVYQIAGATVGACYPKCTPFAPNGCAQGQECVIGSFDGTTGYCKPQGATPAGSSCTGSSVSTTCVPGYVCIPDPSQHFCREQCDFWGNAHDCSDTKQCTPPGVCTGDVIDTAAVGVACATTSTAGTLCGPVGPKLLGWCIGSPGKTVCSKWCRMQGADCGASQTCQPTNVPSIGYCQ